METQKKKEVIRACAVIVIMICVLLSISFYLYPKSAIGNPLCKRMAAQGYYETEWDTAGHNTCRIIHNGSRWNPYSTNDTCMNDRFQIDEQNLTNYGFHCVWGGAGYWIFVLCFAIPFIILALITSLIVMIYDIIHPKVTT